MIREPTSELTRPGAAIAPQSDGPFWRLPLARLLEALGAGVDGLSAAEAATRLAREGLNLLVVRRERPLVLQFLSRFRNPLILLLLAASAVSVFTGDLASVALIVGVVVISVVLDFVQEYRAGRAAERLRESVAARVTVLRGGVAAELPAANLVPGDIVLLTAGDLVPADCRLFEATDLFVNQALLTGEPYPAEKDALEAPPGAELDAARNAVFMGTAVVSGSGRALVCRTGNRTALGEIGTALAEREPPTAFERGSRNFGLMILRLAILLVGFVLIVNLFRGRPWLESLLFAVALAVGLTPELLPMIVSVTLSRGALRMASHKVIVKRLAAILDLGGMDTLCTDKTGTLTEARIRLERHLDPSGRDRLRPLELAYLNSFFQTGLRSPLDEAILRHSEIDPGGHRKLDEVPFDFERRRLSVLLERSGTPPLLLVKGALEDVLRLSTRYEGNGPDDLRPLDAAARQEFTTRFAGLSSEGFRVLGIASRQLPAEVRHVTAADENELIFAGFAAFEDPPKPSAAAAVRALEASGVTVKVVTGDNELVTGHLCGELGILVAGVLTGGEIRTMDDTALDARVDGATLFCRVTPPEKRRVILALRRRGHVVGYLGDGINDAPSLKSADVGISVEGGVEVAKEAADLILLEQDLGVLHRGVREGRRTFGNIMKYIMMGTSSSFGNMLSMAGAAAVLPFLPMLPVQILLNNLLYDISEIPIPMDRVDEEDLARPHRWDSGFIHRFILVVGPVSSMFDFLTFYLLLHLFHAGEALFHTGWFVESLATQVLVIFVIRTRSLPLRSRPSRLLALTSLGIVLGAVLLPFTPMAPRLGFVPLPPGFLPTLAALIVVYLALVEAAKRWFYRTLAAN